MDTTVIIEDGSELSRSSTSNQAFRIKKFHIIYALIVVFVISFTVISFILYSLSLSESESNKETTTKSDVCATEECVSSAKILINNMNQSVNPCEDFYEFVCGLGKFEDDEDMISPIQKLVTEQIKILLEKEKLYNDLESIKVFKLAQNLYHSCLNKDSSNVKNIIQEASSQLTWSIFVTTRYMRSKSAVPWTENIYAMKYYGLQADYLLNFSIEKSRKNSSNIRIHIGPPSFGIDRTYFLHLGHPKVEEYFEDMCLIAQMLNNGITDSIVDEIVRAIDFETKLANATKSYLENVDFEKLYNPFGISSLEKMLPKFPWLEYFQRMLTISGSSDIIDNNEVIMITDFNYLTTLYNLLEFNEFSKSDLESYLMGRAVYEMFTILTVPENAEKECIKSVQQQFPEIIGLAYLQHYYHNENNEDNIYEIEKYVKEEMLKMINHTVRLNFVTKDKIYKKMENLTSYIGTSRGIQLIEIKDLIHLFQGLEIKKENYFHNILNLNKYYFNYYFWSLGPKNEELQLITKEQEFLTILNPSSVNAYCHNEYNSIEIPAAFLQGFGYNRHRPMYMNFGILGWTIGHEQAHTLDDFGIQFDSNGLVSSNYWSNSESKSFFRSRAQCIKEQYGSYTLPELGMNVNGESTVGENVSDNIGLLAAYNAYKSWAKHNEKEMVLPGLNYTVNQLFWISAASMYCGKDSSATLESIVLTDAHSPRRYRVIGSIRNTKEFGTDFNCPLGSEMNPSNKCKVYGK